MSSFDAKAREWDKDKMHIDRSEAIAAALENMIPFNASMKAIEYGAGTGILSFLLKDKFAQITLMDSSREMINVCNEKVSHHQANHLIPVFYDLEYADFDHKFNVIFNQMVLHHVNDVETIFGKFYTMLLAGGYLAIADLYLEDGTFHGPDVKVHPGFDPERLKEILMDKGFKSATYTTCYEVERPNGNKYPLFLLVAQK